ncbi:MAG: response regulator [Pseudomonadales bacterium]|nr:response regulator [Pseudomonadales bacterium]
MNVRTGADVEHARRARTILYVGLSIAFGGSIIGVLFYLVPGAIGVHELWLVAGCAIGSGLMLLVLATRPNVSLSLVAATAAVFFALYLAAAALVAYFETGQLLLMFPYLLWYYLLIAFNKFANTGRSQRYIDHLIVGSAVLVFAVYLVDVELEHYALQLGAPAVFLLSFVSFALFLDLFAQYRERYIAESERLLAIEAASATLRQNEERLRQLFDRSGTGVGRLGIDGGIETCNSAFLAIARHDSSSGKAFADLVHEEDRAAWRADFAKLVRRECDSFDFEGRLAGPEATPRRIHTSFVVTAASEILGESIMFICQDVTEQRAAEEKLRQSQKIESLGQLTGGIAHDFNNLLTVILGNGEMLEQDPSLDATARQLTGTIVTAAERGAGLTRRLLAFARRQPLEPKVVDVNQLIRGIEGLLRRTLTEDIDIEIDGAPELWQSEIDPGQLEAALVNLAVNARDAMPNGGRLTIETANVTLDDWYAESNSEVIPGQYAMVSVSDTGSGMSRETLDRAFEPFFTTKGASQGSGLGLSMVFGFVKQSGGHAKIYSEIGEGTSVKLYLPRCRTTGESPYEPVARRPDAVGTEHILVVEDDDLVREHVLRQLAALGYRVTGASRGATALELLEAATDVDLLFTDVVMPGGMNGRQLAEAAKRIRPGIRVLFTSGYTENAIVHQGRLDRGVQLLNKPYRREDLAAKVRAVLDAKSDSSG